MSHHWSVLFCSSFAPLEQKEKQVWVCQTWNSLFVPPTVDILPGFPFGASFFFFFFVISFRTLLILLSSLLLTRFHPSSLIPHPLLTFPYILILSHQPTFTMVSVMWAASCNWTVWDQWTSFTEGNKGPLHISFVVSGQSPTHKRASLSPPKPKHSLIHHAHHAYFLFQ